MKKLKCNICKSKRAKRKCSKVDSMICTLCCADNRNEELCSKCSYFKTAQNYNKSKQNNKKHFIIKIDEEIEKSVDTALILVERQQIQKGRELLSQLLNKYPENHAVNYGLGVTYAFEGNHELAIPYFKKATEVFPYFTEAYYNLALAYKEELDLKNAITNFTKVCDIGDPTEQFTLDAKNFITDLEEQIFRTDKISLDQYFEAQELFENSHDKMVEKKWELAKIGFKKVLEITPNHTQSLGNLGLCYGHLGEKNKALDTLDKALAIDPYYEPAIINKKAIESAKDGEPITVGKIASVEYYKDSYNIQPKKRSTLSDTLRNIMGI
jgi:tetratricopeptide (TPR) repeat protein